MLSDFEIKQSCDIFTDDIFDVPNACVIKSKISRLVVDPNRAPDDIEMECRLCSNGVVVSVDEGGRQIYREPPKENIISERVEKYHVTFHSEIEKNKPQAKFLIDGHSMWSIGPKTKSDAGKKRPDICLGNRDFTTCSRAGTLKFVNFFQDNGYSVSINDPYSGKFILGNHCSRHGLLGIQIELNRTLYLDEKTLRPQKNNISKLHENITDLVEFITEEF